MAGGAGLEYTMLKKVSMDFVTEQLKLRGENVILSDALDRYDILLKDKDIKIKIKFSKPVKRSISRRKYWEFTKVTHISRLWPEDSVDYYLLVGLDDRKNVIKIWRVAVDDDLICRKNQIFIPVDKCDEFKKYEMEIIDGRDEFRWID